MDHSFILVNFAESKPKDFLHFVGAPEGTRLHDELVRYVGDSLQWIPTVNPARQNEDGYGLNLYGPTVISTERATLAGRIFRAWANLFRLGPETLILTGAWCETEGASGSGRYSQITISRDVLVSTLDRIADDCHRVVESAGALFLLHIGI